MGPEQEKRRSARDLCLSSLVLAFLLAPAIKLAFAREKSPVDLLENRRAADFPAAPRSALDWAAWPHAFEAWHNDHFGLREKFVRAHNELMIFGLHTSPSPRIAVGREHWIFTLLGVIGSIASIIGLILYFMDSANKAVNPSGGSGG